MTELLILDIIYVRYNNKVLLDPLVNIDHSITTQSKTRKFSARDAMAYRFSFNGKEKDNETYGDGNAYDFGARIYDARLGRWLSIDPLFAKYPGYTPYNFAVNSPLVFRDFDGRDIIISGTAEFKTTTFNHLQSLTNAKLVMLQSGKVVEASTYKGSPLNIAASGAPSAKIPLSPNKPVGTSLISSLIIDNKHTTTILKVDVMYSGNSTTPTDIDSQKPGVGSSSTIHYDPNEKGEDIVNKDGSTGRPSEIGLGHELGHAAQNARGTPRVDTDLKDPDLKGAIGYPSMTNREVKNRIETDNAIRRENGVVERAEPKK